jgi:hypothetical protein
MNAALGASILFLLSSPDTVFKLSMASAYAGLALLSASLIIGPLNVLRGLPIRWLDESLMFSLHRSLCSPRVGRMIRELDRLRLRGLPSVL